MVCMTNVHAWTARPCVHGPTLGKVPLRQLSTAAGSAGEQQPASSQHARHCGGKAPNGQFLHTLPQNPTPDTQTQPRRAPTCRGSSGTVCGLVGGRTVLGGAGLLMLECRGKMREGRAMLGRAGRLRASRSVTSACCIRLMRIWDSSPLSSPSCSSIQRCQHEPCFPLAAPGGASGMGRWCRGGCCRQS